ncbi:MAG: hypothetical protein WEF86_01975 [Gemmatimonadota bacterium]
MSVARLLARQGGTTLLVLLATASPAEAQLRLSGQADILAKSGADERGLNRNFRLDSPFSQIRARLFAQHWLTDDVGVFMEAFVDSESDPRLNGGYIVINNVRGHEWLSIRAGMAPSLIGNFGLRSTYFNSNPLIGVPLAWQHRTTLDAAGLTTASDLLRRRESNVISLPILYDACWNLQWEFMGEVGMFEYSVGITPGSMSNPMQSSNEAGVQVLGRAGLVPLPELRLGVSAGVGPYIGGPNRDPLTTATSFPGGPADYDQRLVGIDAEYSLGRAILFAEAYHSSWEVPLVAEDLSALAGYVEGRYDFLPEWFGAARIGSMIFSDITVEDGLQSITTGWDDDVLRVESSLTYRWARELQVRVDWQHTRFLTGEEEPVDLLALQVRAVF